MADDISFIFRVNNHIEKVQSLAGQYVEPLNRAYRTALEDFLNLHSKMMRLYSARDYANNMHVHLRDKIKLEFERFPEAYFDDKPNRSFKLLIDGRMKGVDVFLAFILKKQGRGYRTSNIKTAAVTDYSRQVIDYLNFEPIFQASLFDLKGDGKNLTVVNLPKCANLVAGYQINPTWADFAQLAITMPFSFRKIILLHDFTSVSAAAVADIVEMPTQQPTTVKAARIRRRTSTVPQRNNVMRFRELSTSDVSEDADIRKFNERNG